MKMHLDKQLYNLSLTNISNHLIAWYESNKHEMDNMTFDNGKKLDFSPKSLARIALKTALVPIVIPTLKMVYSRRGAELPKHEKHTDFIDYMMVSAFGILKLFDNGEIYVESIESPTGDSRIINTLSTVEPELAGVIRELPTQAESKEEDISTGGQTLFRSGEDRDGEDEVNQGDNT